MARRKRPAPPRLDDTWIKTPEFTANGRHIAPGQELKIAGERGRFRFQQHVTTPAGKEWIDVIGGPKGCATWRSFRPDRIKRVHRIKEKK